MGHPITIRLTPNTTFNGSQLTFGARNLSAFCRSFATISALRVWLLLSTILFLVLVVFGPSPEASTTHSLPMVKEEGRGHVSSPEVKWRRGERPWREVVAGWDEKFKVPTRAEGAILYKYPDEVKFLVNEEKACHDDPPLALALVVTAPSNAKKRHFIRNTWGHHALAEVTGIRPIFVLGQTRDVTIQAGLLEESRRHHDIIQANFLDSYQNLTYKTTALLTWATQYCSSSPFVLKIDDDVIANTIALKKYLVNFLEENPRPDKIMGKVRCCDPVLRSGKWGVSQEAFPKNSYPPYVAGPSYMVPMPVIPALMHAVRRTKFLFLEDVFTTGLSAKAGNISHHNIFTLTNSLPNKMDVFWCSGARVFQENVGLVAATDGWNKVRILENITNPPAYVLPQ